MDQEKENVDVLSTKRKEDDQNNAFVVLPLSGGIARVLSWLDELLETNSSNRILHAAGYEEAERDWERIATAPTFEEAFVDFARAAQAEGWGRVTIVSIDRNEKKACLRVEIEANGPRSASSLPWGMRLMGGKLAGLCAKFFGVHCSANMRIVTEENTSHIEYIIEPSSDHGAETLAHLLAQERAKSATMVETLAILEQEVREKSDTEENLKFEVEERKLIEENLKFEVEERSQMEEELRQKLRLVVEQQQAIHRMSVPIIQVWDGVLALPMVGPLSAARAAEMTEKLLGELATTRSHDVIIDFTGAELEDATTAEHILRIVHAVELMGARCLITGIQPAAAKAIISVGIDLGRVKTLSNLREGIKECMKRAGKWK